MMVAMGMVRVDGFEIHTEGGSDKPQGYPGCGGQWGEVRETEKSTCLLGFGCKQSMDGSVAQWGENWEQHRYRGEMSCVYIC